MKSVLAALCAASSFMSVASAAAPKLVVAIAVDQFRGDYLTRFKSDYNAGLLRLMEQGAWFTDAHYEQFPTVTAVGHSIFLTGAMPSMSGIIGNDWYDREKKSSTTSVADAATKLVGGGDKAGASPRRLLVSTVGDELKAAGKAGKVIGISFKDRSAILPAGHGAEVAVWFDTATRNFVTSTYYRPTLPEWAAAFNKDRLIDQWLGKEWKPVTGGAPFAKLAATPGNEYYDAVYQSPYGNEILEMLAEKAIETENLGRGPATDLLTVSFSSNDSVGHEYGPDSPQVRDISIQTDRVLGRFLNFLDRRIGLKNVLIAFTADHGVAPVPEEAIKRRLPGGRLSEAALAKTVDAALAARFGEGKYVVGKASGGGLYLDHALLRSKNAALDEARRIAAEALRGLPYIARAYTHGDLAAGRVSPDMIGRALQNGFHPSRGADVYLVQQAYWLAGTEGTSHSTPYRYDTHVPVIFFGAGVRPGRHYERVAVNDIAPTLAAMLEISPPSGSSGRVLTSVF